MVRFLFIFLLIISCNKNPLGEEKSDRDTAGPVGSTISGWVWSLSSPDEGSISNDATPVVNLVGAGEEEGGSVQLYTDAVCSVKRGSFQIISGGATTHSNISFDDTGLDDGIIAFRAQVTDTSGNISDCTDISLSYQLAAGTPVVSIINAEDISSFGANSYDLNGACSEPGQDVVIDVGGISPAIQPVCLLDNTWSMTGLDVSSLAIGSVTITADHQDTDLVNAVQFTVNVNKLAPSVSINTAVSITSANQASYSLSGTCSDPGEDVDISTGGVTPAIQPTCQVDSTWALIYDVSAAIEGSVVITADHQDSGANPAPQASITVLKDTVAPTVVEVQGYTWTLSSPIAASVSNDSTPIIDLSGAGIEDGGSVQIFDDAATCTSSQGSSRIISAGATNHSDIGFLSDGSEDGLKSFHVVMTDLAGNISTCVDIGLNYTLDTIAPGVAITSAPMITTANQNSYNFSGTCSEPSQEVTVSVGGISPLTQPTCSGGNTWFVVGLDVSGAPEGNISVIANHADVAGNNTTATLGVLKDTIAPTDTEILAFTWDLNSPSNGSTSNDNTPVVRLSNASSENGASVQVYDNVTCTSPQGIAQIITVGDTDHNDITYATDNSDDGLISFFVRITDPANNISNCVDVSVSYTLDTAIPTVAILNAPDITSSNAASYNFDGTCSEPGQIVTTAVGMAVPTTQPICTGANTWSVVGMDASGAAEGTIAVTANHQDLAGNNAVPASINISKDATPPTVAQIQSFTWTLSPVSGSVSNDGTPTLTLSGASADVENGSVQVYTNSSCTIAEGAAQVITGSATTHNDLSFAVDGSADGLKEFYVILTDAGANASPCADILTSYTLDTTPASVAITTSPIINSVNQGSYNFSGTCSEIGQVVTVSVGGISPGTQPNCVAGNVWSVTGLNVSGLADGSVNILADHIDIASNAAPQASVNVNKDSTAPSIVAVQGFSWALSSPANGSTSTDIDPVVDLSGAGSEEGGSVQIFDDALCLSSKGSVQVITTGMTNHSDILYASDGSDDATINFSAIVTDSAGNPSGCADLSIGYTLDTQPPTVAIVSSPAINGINSTSYDFDGTCSEPGQTVTVSVGGIAPGAQPLCTGANTWAVTGLNVSALPDGSVTILADHQDAAANAAPQASINVNKDTTAPTITAVQAFSWSLSSPANGSTSNDNTPVVSLTAAATENGGSVQIFDDAICTVSKGAAQVITIGATNHSDISYLIDGSDDGLIQFFAIVTDAANNPSGCADISLSYTLDTSVPTVTITTPAADITAGNVTSYGLTGTCSEPTREVTVVVGGISPGTQPVCTGGNTWSITGFDVSGVSDGTVNITADHSNSAGTNATQATTSVNKDSTPPSSSLINSWSWTLSSPNNGTTSNDATPNIALSGAAVENGASVQVHDNGSCSSSKGASQTITAGATNHPDITYATDGSADGLISFFVIVTDAAGNASTCTNISRSYTLDTVAPSTLAIQAFTWTLSSPTDGSTSIDGTPIVTLSGAAAENGGSVQVHDNISCSSAQGISRTIAGGTTNHNDITYATDGSDDGLKTFFVALTDVAGNTSPCVDISRSYTLDTTIPTVSITVAPDITGANVTSYNFSGSCSDNGQEVTVSVGGVSPVTQPTCFGGGWSVTGLDVSAASDGTIPVLADHQDSAGNDAVQASVNINKDATAPTDGQVQAFSWTLSSPNNGVTSNDNTPVISLSGASSENGGDVQIFDDISCTSSKGATQTITAGATNHPDISYATDGSDDNLISFYVVITDAANNVSNCVDISRSYTLDTIAPVDAVIQAFTWTLSSPANGATSNDNTPIISMTGGAAEDGSSIQVYGNAGCTVSRGSSQVITSGATTHNDIVLATDGSDDGLNRFYVTASDQSGNASGCVDISRNYTLDTTLPTIAITSAPTITTSSASSYDVSGTCSENGRVVTINIGGLGFTAPCAFLSWVRNNADVSSLADGPVTITADISDVAGNDAVQASVVVTKDTTTPTDPTGLTTSEWAEPDRSEILSWTASTDPDGFVVAYEIAMGTSVGAVDVVNWIDIGNVLTYALVDGVDGASFTLSPNVNYFMSLRARDNDGKLSSISTAGATFFTRPTIYGSENWFDAANTSTLFTDTGCSTAAADGNDVACWTASDSSGDSYVSSTPASYNAANSSLEFNGTSDGTYVLSRNQFIRNVFIVGRLNTGYTNLAGIFNQATDVDAHNIRVSSDCFLGNGNGGEDASDFSFGGTMRVNGAVGECITPDTPFIVFAQKTSFASITPQLGQTVSSRYWDGGIYEVFTYDNALTTFNINQLEGYLACKWDLRDQLPIGHPYYNVVPTNDDNCP